jgi:hypothetical protein
MPRFLDHEQLGSEIRRLLKGAGVRCAVAFWGDGAAASLFAGPPPADARIICDIAMGGSNPRELEELGAPRNPALKHLPGLHAKVYLSSEGLVTGSANASNNGIGFLDTAALIEAGTFHEPDSKAWKQAASWFDQLWKRAPPVDEAALEAAAAAWRRRKRSEVRLTRPPNSASLLDVVAAEPERFRGVGFVFTTGSSTVEQRDETAEAVISSDKARPIPLLSKSERRAVANWRVADLFSEWEPEDISAWPERFACAHRGARGRTSYWFYRRVHTAVLDGGRGMVMARRAGTLRGELGFEHGRKAMAAVDEERLDAVFNDVRPEVHRLHESGEKLVELLARLDLLN